YAVNPGPGTQKWLADTVGAVKFSTPTVGSDGTIYVGARDNRLHAYNPDGSVKWQDLVGVDGDVSNAPAIGSDGTIYMGGTGRLHAVNPDGSLKWAVPTGGVIFTASPAIAADGSIYIATLTGLLVKVSSAGAVLWSLNVGRHIKY